MKYRFVHFVLDDKFTNDSIKCFESAGLTINDYYFVSKLSNPLYYIKDNRVKIINFQDVKKIIGCLCQTDIVVLHSLYSLPSSLITSIPTNIKVIWYAWGFDLYSNPYPAKPLLEPNDGRFMKFTYKRLLLYNFLKKRTNWLAYRLNESKYTDYTQKSIIEALSRIDFFAGVFPMEYDMLAEKYPTFKAKKIVHNYIHPDEFQQEAINDILEVSGNNVLVGNSAAYLCNHFDILHYLHIQVKNINFKIYCPLSYGGRNFYKKSVIKYGKKLFGDRFVPLLNYLPFDEYEKIIKSCSCQILGYKQQAATCNCLTSMWNGLKVFVPKDSMNYEEYKNIEGLEIYNIEEELNDFNISKSINNINHQRSIISSIYSYDRWKDDLNESINIIKLG